MNYYYIELRLVKQAGADNDPTMVRTEIQRHTICPATPYAATMRGNFNRIVEWLGATAVIARWLSP